MKTYLVKTPFWLRWLYPNLLWRKKGAVDKTVYLTFDDGPTPEVTAWVLAQLKRFEAKATFFCIGKNAEAHPEIMRQLEADGHAIGQHTFSHLNGWKTPDALYMKDIIRAEKSISTRLFRPPYGRIRRSQIKNLQAQYEIVMWDVISGDFDIEQSPESCTANCIENIEDGSIVVFHDSVKAWPRLEKCLPAVLEHLQKEGYRCRAL